MVVLSPVTVVRELNGPPFTESLISYDEASAESSVQLNAMLPVVAGSLFEAQELLGVAAELVAHRCIAGVEVNEARTRGYAAEGLGDATVLATELGYDAVANQTNTQE